MSNGVIRVLCVDDNPDVAEVLEATVSAETDMESVGVVGTADRLPDEVESRRPDVVLLDLTMPGRDPMEAMEAAAVRRPETRTVVVSGYDDQARVDEAFRRGAWGFVPKHAPMTELLSAVRTVAGGGVWMNGPG